MTSPTALEAEPSHRINKALRGSILWVFAALMTLGIALILTFNLVIGPQVSVELGKPATEEIVAPEAITYSSDVLTERARQQAAAAVPDQYTAIDRGIARAQLNLTRSIFSFIDAVRSDPTADHQTKLGYLATIQGVSVNPQVAEDLLQLSQTEFVGARDNLLQIVEEIMRLGVYEDQLSDAKRRAALGAAFDLTPAQDRIVTSLAPQLITPNIFLDEAATAELQAEARANAAPVTQVVTKGERIIRVGDVVDEADIEMLGRLGLLQRQLDWPDLLSSLLASLLAVTIITLYWGQFMAERFQTGRMLSIMGMLLLLSVLGAKLLLSSRSVYSYLYPAAALSIMTAVIFDARVAIVVTLANAGLSGYIAQNSLELAVYAAVGGMIAVLTLHDTQRINALFRAGLVAAVGNVATILMFRLPTNISAADLLTLLLFGILNGPVIAAGLSLAGIFLIGTIFRVTTSLQLQELSRLDHPLLQELLRRAPGTYHHSIMVANLAEQAAEKIKANSTLVRVGAFYHDVGKMNRPPFFTENQNGGNPHDHLDPYSSARIIIGHVSDGLDLARRYRLPNRVRDFIAEHHGDRVLKTFYTKAQDAVPEGEEVDISRFQYKGPRPRSRETAIVQLADSIEATSSALRPSTEEDIEKLVTTIIDEHLKEGQLDNSGLTLGDIRVLRDSFTKTVKGRFHVRVRYPGNEEMMSQPEPTEERVAAIEGPSPAPEAMAEGLTDAADETPVGLDVGVLVDDEGRDGRRLAPHTHVAIGEDKLAEMMSEEESEAVEEMDEPV
ncbi:MAG: HD family phosphohydrolase [Candidatus Promineifilaceae bacterium]